MTPYYDQDGITIYHGDCREVIPAIGSVDCVVTSPPYGNRRQYGLNEFVWREVVPPALSLFETGTTLIVNLGLFVDGGRLSRYWDDLIDMMELAGHWLQGWYVWDQGSGLPGDFAGRLCPSHEWIFHFANNLKPLEKTEVSNCGKESTIRGGIGMRNPDGSTKFACKKSKRRSKKVADTVIRIGRAKEESKVICHPAIFPVALPRKLMSIFSQEGKTVVDPFMGSGTTLVAAQLEGRSAIGIEINEKYCEIAANRLSQKVLF